MYRTVVPWREARVTEPPAVEGRLRGGSWALRRWEAWPSSFGTGRVDQSTWWRVSFV